MSEIIDIPYKLEKCYDKASKIWPKNRWYASLLFLFIILATTGYICYILIPKNIDFLYFWPYIVVWLVLYFSYLILIVTKENKRKFNKVSIKYNVEINNFSDLRMKKIEIFREEMISNYLYKNKDINVDRLDSYIKTSNTQHNTLLRTPKKVAGFSLLVAYFLGIITDSIKPFFVMLLNKNPLSFLLIAAGLLYLGFYCIYMISNIRDSIYEYLNRRSLKYKEISIWLELLIANEVKNR